MKRFSKITTTQLARICGVSQGTVDRALHGREGISPETRARILAVAREYDYIPSVEVGEKGHSMLIGVVLYDLYNEYFSKLAMSLVNAARAVGYSVIFLFSDKELKSEKSALDYFNYIGVDGIVLFSAGSDDEAYAAYLRSLMKPIVLIGNRLCDLAYIGIDDRRAMYDLARRLLLETDGGEITYFAPVLRKPLHRVNAQRLRLEGFRAAMEESGSSYRIVTEESGLPEDCAGVLCATDYYVLRVLRHFGDSYQKPLAGFDNSAFLRYLPKRILTVEYSTDTIAEECINYLVGRKYNPSIDHRVVYSNEKA